MDELAQFQEAWRSGAYLFAIAVLAGGLTKALRAAERFVPVWSKLPDGLKRWVPLAFALLGAFSEAVFLAPAGQPWTTTAFRAIASGIVAGITAIGGHHFLNPTKHATRTDVDMELDIVSIDADGFTASAKVGSKPRVMVRMVTTLLALALVGCSWLKPATRTVKDAAEILCGAYFSESAGLSVEDAARAFCSTEKQLRPWLDQVLAAKQTAGAQAAAAQAPPESDAGS
jgi:hypothetical protein